LYKGTGKRKVILLCQVAILPQATISRINRLRKKIIIPLMNFLLVLDQSLSRDLVKYRQ